jgi:hypothetical protein
MKLCTDTHGFVCIDRTAAARQSIEPNPVSLKKSSDVKTTKSTMIAAKVEPPASRPAGGGVANSNARTIQEQVGAATAVAERMTVAALVPAPEPEANKDRSNQLETVLRGDAEKTGPAQPRKTDQLVAILIAHPEIKSVSDLTGKIVAINDLQFASDGNVQTAIAAAGASEVQLSNSKTKAIDRVISREVPAAVLTLVSQEAAKGFPDIAGFKIFRIPLSPGSSKARP